MPSLPPAYQAICAQRQHQHLASLLAELRRDVIRYWARSGIDATRAVRPLRFLNALVDPALACVALHRFAHWAYVLDLPLVPGVLGALNRRLFRITISAPSCVGGGWSIRHPAGVHFHAIAGEDLTLFADATCTADDVPVSDDARRAPCLGHRVQLAAHAAIVGPVTVGDDVEIGFRTVVTVDIPSHSIVVGDAGRMHLHRQN